MIIQNWSLFMVKLKLKFLLIVSLKIKASKKKVISQNKRDVNQLTWSILLIILSF